MTRFVLDCSMTMAWSFADEDSPRATAVMAALDEGEAVVPSHWPLEVANVLAIAERRKRTTEAKIARFIDILNRLPIVVDEQTSKKAFGEVLTLARTLRLSAYDAAYLELAMREACPLASLDASLNEAATGLGIVLFQG
ncbi:MAG: type II toxin-antitoxin system VapC family toxin [Planctomycetes bacterium]|nr:type II toxin-antitoxin system VapC family toxin [Planctomycetota bacterium]MBU4399768.1 type II toxin-antitoxin system VapC family toxin [Planctomycetota bacterium]MCG2682524.1 type II toxin-antitoxin system VapC family toxin [Planctomycetales bacterium]